MRIREIRGYSRRSGVQLGYLKTIRTYGTYGLLVAAVIGVCGLATFATAQTDRLVAASAKQGASKSTEAIEARSDVATGTPATLLSTIEEATPAATSQRGSDTMVMQTQEPQKCNTAKRNAAIAARAYKTQTESSRHRHVMWSLQTTGLVTKFLNPYMYSYRFNQENALHKSTTAQIERTYRAALVRAHCS